MNPVKLYRIFLAAACVVILYLWFFPRTEVVYESDKRVLEENKRLTKQIEVIQHERDSIRLERSRIKEMIVYRTKELKKDEKIINDADITQLDSIIRAGL